MKILKLFLATSLISLATYGQDKSYFSELVPPSPDVAQLGTYGATQVGKYTGTANVSVPLHTISQDGLQIPIALSYQTGGIKVSQEASWVGLGWNLSANAVITRQINGYDDLTNNQGADGYLHSATFTFPYTTASETTLINARNASLPIDTEPDLFTASIFGESVQFVLPKNNGNSTIQLEATMLNSKVLKVYYNQTDSTFEVVNGRGFIFYFGHPDGSDDVRREYTTTFRSDGSPGVTTDAGALASSVGPIFGGGNSNQKTTAWHIYKVKAPSGREIVFNYQKAFYFGYPGFSDSYDFNICTESDNQSGLGYLNYNQTHRKVTCHITGFEAVHLNQISGDFGTVDFTLSSRDDISSRYQTPTNFNLISGMNTANLPKRLTAISVKNADNQVIKTINLTQTYFNSDENQDTGSYKKEKYIRSKLDKVTVDDKEYNFDYHLPNELPAKDSKDEDFWGYYNGKGNTSRIPSFGRLVYCNSKSRDMFFNMDGANRSSDPAYGKIGILTEVTYPTGGKTVFEYEGNRATVDKSTVVFNNSFPNSSDNSYNYQYLSRAVINDFTVPVSASETFTMNNALPFTYNLEVTVSVTCGFNCGEPAYTPNGSHNIVEIEKLDSPGAGIVGTIPYFHSNSGNNTKTETFALADGDYRINFRSTSNDGGSYKYLSATLDAAQYVQDPYITNLPFQEFAVGGLRIRSVTNKDYNNAFVSKKQFGYTQSKYGQIVSSGILMNELVYHSKYGIFDYTPQEFLQVFTMSSGSPLSLEFSAQGSHMGYSYVAEEELDASDLAKGSVTTAYVNEKNEAIGYYLGTTLEVSPSLPSGITQNYNDVHYGNAYLLGVPPKSSNYKNGSMVFDSIVNSSGTTVRHIKNVYQDQPLDSVTVYKAFLAPVNVVADYEYKQKGDLYLPQVITTKEYFNGELLTTTVTNTYETSRFLPRSTETTTSRNGTTVKEERFYPFDSDHSVSTYPHMGDLVTENRVTEPVLVRTYENTTLLSQTLFKFGNFSGKYWRDEVLQAKDTDALSQRMQFVAYDGKGNLREYKQTDGTPVTYIWGYNDMYPVAKVENATYSQVTGTGINLTTIGDVTTTDAAMRTELDKIRTGLTGAMVTTYTYKQGVGISSLTDPRGYTTYYEYDTAQRLKMVKDADGKLLSENEYHFKPQN